MSQVSLTGDQLIAALACHLPAGTGTSQRPEWSTRDVAAFLADHLTAAGYRLVADEEILQLVRDQQAGDERRAH